MRAFILIGLLLDSENLSRRQHLIMTLSAHILSFLPKLCNFPWRWLQHFTRSHFAAQPHTSTFEPWLRSFCKTSTTQIWQILLILQLILPLFHQIQLLSANLHFFVRILCPQLSNLLTWNTHLSFCWKIEDILTKRLNVALKIQRAIYSFF